MTVIRFFLLSVLTISFAFAQETNKPAVNSLIPIEQIVSFQEYPVDLQKLIFNAQELIKQNLTYTFGSADPRNKGMDCSGTIFYLLRSVGVKDVPRQSDKIYEWARAKGKFYVVKDNDLGSPEFSQLKPGDLLFWSGTYKTEHVLGISHVMIYLGKTKEGKALMFGSSDGRYYQGKPMWGVSVFDFKMPASRSESLFVGYGCMPGFMC